MKAKEVEDMGADGCDKLSSSTYIANISTEPLLGYVRPSPSAISDPRVKHAHPRESRSTGRENPMTCLFGIYSLMDFRISFSDRHCDELDVAHGCPSCPRSRCASLKLVVGIFKGYVLRDRVCGTSHQPLVSTLTGSGRLTTEMTMTVVAVATTIHCGYGLVKGWMQGDEAVTDVERFLDAGCTHEYKCIQRPSRVQAGVPTLSLTNGSLVSVVCGLGGRGGWKRENVEVWLEIGWPSRFKMNVPELLIESYTLHPLSISVPNQTQPQNDTVYIHLEGRATVYFVQSQLIHSNIKRKGGRLPPAKVPLINLAGRVAQRQEMTACKPINVYDD
ncbi:hypothetical protein ARMGADRAFT_1032135 [Armillaria gallica]|uniref:Uncharacterized protein n=1 Tax=Armillaria gallica TaxID=47427 RepID=A0A2H3DAD6_ARMGA|nr:hypothetical protein ARMGADRAFT_1032135 [Armillaria gallica]